MLYYIEEYLKTVAITGYRNVKFLSAETFLKTSRQQVQQIQFFDASLIASWQHLYFAAINALQSFHAGTNVSKSLAVETILYASAVRQIQKAIRLLGIKPSTASAAIVVFGETREEVAGLLDEVSRYLDTAPDDAVLELDEVKAAKIREAFNIADQELRTVSKSSDSNVALVSLVVERVALLATQL